MARSDSLSRTAAAISTVNKGVVELRIAVRLEEMNCSPQVMSANGTMLPITAITSSRPEELALSRNPAPAEVQKRDEQQGADGDPPGHDLCGREVLEGHLDEEERRAPDPSEEDEARYV